MKKFLVGCGALVLAMMAGCGANLVINSPVMAEGFSNVCDDPAIPDDLKEAAGCNLGKEDNALNVVVNLIQVVLGLFGLIGVGVIVYGGLVYATSVGDTSKTVKAKNIILYGVVGLVVSMLAFAIVRFVSGIIG